GTPAVDPAESTPPADGDDAPKASAAVAPAASSGLGEEAAPAVPRVELGYLATVGASNGHANGHSNGHANGSSKGFPSLNLGGIKVAFATQADAPSCMDC